MELYRSKMFMGNSRQQIPSSNFQLHQSYLQQVPAPSTSRKPSFLPALFPVQSNNSNIRMPRSITRTTATDQQNMQTNNQPIARNNHIPISMKPVLAQQSIVLKNHRCSTDTFKSNLVAPNAVERSFWNSKLNNTSSVSLHQLGNTCSDKYGDRSYKSECGTSKFRMDDIPQRKSTVQPIEASFPNNESFNKYMKTDQNSNASNAQQKVYGSSDREKLFIFTGTVENVIKWNKIFCNYFCYFEVFGSIISIQEGTIKQQKIMLLRDKKGPVLQVVYYSNTLIDIGDFFIAKVLRCAGNMIGPNVLKAISIRSATDAEIEVLPRLSLICDQAVSHYLNV